MNMAHIRAIIATGHPANKGLIIDGKLVATNGEIAVVVPDDFALEDRAFDKLEPVWRKAITAETVKATVGGLVLGRRSDSWIRQIGPCAVNERFVRAFGIDCDWYTSTFDSPLIVRVDGYIVGLVMPMRSESTEPCRVEPTDEELFAPIAAECNGFYLLSNKEIDRRIASNQDAIAALEKKKLHAEQSA